MGSYLTLHAPVQSIDDSLRIGSNGSAAFLVKQWIAGYAISPGAIPDQARKVRQHWLSYFGQQHRGQLFRLARLQDAVLALQDTTDQCSWVDVRDLDRKLVRDIACPRLRSLVLLWHQADTFYAWDPIIRITNDLLEATELATSALEDVGAAWAGLCREATDLLHRGGDGSRFSLG